MYSSNIQRAIKRALFHLQHGHHLFKEEEEVLTCVPYIPLRDQHIIALVADLKPFPIDELEKLKKQIIEVEETNLKYTYLSSYQISNIIVYLSR